MATPTDIDVNMLAVTRLLRLYAEILTELLHRGVVRTRNAPAGDLAELLVAKAYNGDLAANSVKSWDVAAASRVRVNQDLLRLPGAVDVTNRIRDALSAVDETLVSTAGAPGSGASIDAAEIMVIAQTPDVEPNGWCFCGCGEPTKQGKFFVITHDRRAEAKIIREVYGNIAGFVAAHGYPPNRPTNISDHSDGRHTANLG